MTVQPKALSKRCLHEAPEPYNKPGGLQEAQADSGAEEARIAQ